MKNGMTKAQPEKKQKKKTTKQTPPPAHKKQTNKQKQEFGQRQAMWGEGWGNAKTNEKGGRAFYEQVFNTTSFRTGEGDSEKKRIRKRGR